MRSIIAFGVLSVWATAAFSQEVLVTPSFTVTIVGCEEGVVSCDNVKYVGVSKKTGASLKLTGRTLHTKAPDGTPSRFLGYQFRSGKVVYNVTADGLLEVRQGDKVLMSEQGKWE